MKTIKEVVRRWQGDQFSFNENRIRECEETLKDLLAGLVPIDSRELGPFQETKSNLMIELNQKRLVEEIMWR